MVNDVTCTVYLLCYVNYCDNMIDPVTININRMISTSKCHNYYYIAVMITCFSVSKVFLNQIKALNML